MIHEFFSLFQTAAAILCVVSHPEHKGKIYYSSVFAIAHSYPWIDIEVKHIANEKTAT